MTYPGISTHGLLQNQADQVLPELSKLLIHLLDGQTPASTLSKLRIGMLLLPALRNLNYFIPQHSFLILRNHQEEDSKFTTDMLTIVNGRNPLTIGNLSS